MKIVKKVREFAKLHQAEMSRRMGKINPASYAWLEKGAGKISLDDLSRLEKIYLDAGGTKENFSALIRECR